jgi:hypothetical protein
MTTNHFIEARRIEPLVYEPVSVPPAHVAILAPMLVELLNQFRSAGADTNLPIIA